GSTFNVEINGRTPGAAFDQVSLAGRLNLNSDGSAGTRFNLVVNFLPDLGETFTIFQTGGGVTGEFQGMPARNPLVVGEASYQLSYRGGPNGPDVPLKGVLTNNSTVLPSSQNSSRPGQAVTFTATVIPIAPGLRPPTGTVLFFEGSNRLGEFPLNSSA